MKNKLYIAVIALLLVGLYFVNSKSQAAPIPVTYEYKFETTMTEKKANQLGADGWELIALDTEGYVTTFAFKRAK